ADAVAQSDAWINASCAADCDACVSNKACTESFTCISGCGDDYACMDGCAKHHSEGFVLLIEFLRSDGCVGMNCGQECGVSWSSVAVDGERGRGAGRLTGRVPGERQSVGYGIPPSNWHLEAGNAIANTG
ncbi:MAG: hypothetical protein MUF54_12900, partial [Polyangiaceae bacterium]|nr:hypothetical protein [Polyangiaceae bacterium]